MTTNFGRRTALAVFWMASLSGAWAQAQDAGVSYTIHHHYVGPRPLGMGDAFVAVANDYNAIFYNPAGLARREDGELNLFIDAGVSASFPTMMKEVQEAQKTEGTDSQKQQAMLEFLQKQYGRTLGLRLTPLTGFLVRPKWGVALIPADVTLEGTIHQSSGPSINTTVYADTTLAFGYGDDYKGFSNGRLSWGLTGKFINRGYFSKAINFIELASDPNLIKASDMREGYGIDGDLGLLYTPNLPTDGILSLLAYTRPSFGLVVRNMLETKFTNSFKVINKEKTDPPEKMYRVVDIGTRWEYPSFWLFSGRGVMDFRDLGHPAINLRKSLHLGFEFDWSVASWWKGAYRVGLNQGYLTAGLSAMFAVFNLDVVTYSEDVGTYSTPAENRMYAVRLNINW